jgi:hypothetical protein
MRLRLVSNWRDYYDHMFEVHGDDLVNFHRPMRTDMDKRAQLDLLIRVGQNVPHFGTLGALLEELQDDQDRFVVYDDPLAHAGEGKRLLRRVEALQESPDLFATAYIPHESGRAISWRWLQVGDCPFLLEYVSDDAWRSNCGTVEIRVLQASPVRSVVPLIPYPLWAIDYIPLNQGRTRIAVDFNTSPGLRGTGVEEFLTATEVVEALGRAVQAFAD